MLCLSQDWPSCAAVINNLNMSVAKNTKGLLLAQAKSDPGLATLQHSCFPCDGSVLTLHIHSAFHGHHGGGKMGGEVCIHNETFLSRSNTHHFCLHFTGQSLYGHSYCQYGRE